MSLKEPAPEIKSTAVLPYVNEQSPSKQDGVVYELEIPCECGKAYVEETARSTLHWIKELYQDLRVW